MLWCLMSGTSKGEQNLALHMMHERKLRPQICCLLPCPVCDDGCVFTKLSFDQLPFKTAATSASVLTVIALTEPWMTSLSCLLQPDSPAQSCEGNFASNAGASQSTSARSGWGPKCADLSVEAAGLHYAQCELGMPTVCATSMFACHHTC